MNTPQDIAIALYRSYLDYINESNERVDFITYLERDKIWTQ